MKKIKKRLFIAAIMVISLIILAIVSGVGLGQTFNPFSDNTFIINVLDTYNIVEEEGIEIALVFAYVDGNRISAMLEIKDLQGGRLDDNINLKFGNGNRQAFISTPVIYDELLEKALLGIGVIYDNFIGLGNSMSFSINSIMTGVEHVDFKLIEFPLYLYAIERDMISRADWEKAISKEFYDIIWSSEFSRNRRPRYFLNIDEISKYLPNINGVVVSNIGLHNDLLHIQVRHTDKWRNISNFGHLIILDTDYNKLQPVFEIRMGNYTEYVFSIDELENLNKMNLAFTGTVANKIIQGSWEFDIPITKQVNEKLITIELENSLYFSHIDIKVLPMTTSIDFSAMNTVNDSEAVSNMFNYAKKLLDGIYITLSDGNMIELFFPAIMFDNTGGTADFSSFYFDITQIYSITISGNEYRF